MQDPFSKSPPVPLEGPQIQNPKPQVPNLRFSEILGWPWPWDALEVSTESLLQMGLEAIRTSGS